MRSRKKRFRGAPPAAELGVGDGLDPRFDDRDSGRKIVNRKALQLCGQVAETLAVALASSADEVLRDLLVESVVPAPSSMRLLVTLAPPPDATLADVTDHLHRAAGWLRSEVARAITRRKTPELMFRLGS